MSPMIVLFEDRYLADMHPVTLTKPAFAVTCAGYTLYDIASRACDRATYVVRDYLRKTTEHAYGPPLDVSEGPVLFLNASVAPDARLIDKLSAMLADGAPLLCLSDQRIAAALLPSVQVPPADLAPDAIQDYLLDRDLTAGDHELLVTLDKPFQLIGRQEELFMPNVERRLSDGAYDEVRPGVFVGRGVRLPETAVFHTEDGPIILDDEVKVNDFTYFAGPVYVGPRSRIIERSSVKEFTCTGHTCKLGGEVEASIIEPYTNKQHHGFLGHAYVGSWVNMGAGTSNSDLKNTYGMVRIQHRGHRIDTGMQFLGCIIGDYSKSAINTSIFTGKIVGVSSMLYGYVGQNVPSFCNYARSFGQVTEVPAEQAAITQKRMFARRQVEQTEGDVELLRAVFDMTRDERLMSSDLPVL